MNKVSNLIIMIMEGMVFACSPENKERDNYMTNIALVSYLVT